MPNSADSLKQIAAGVFHTKILFVNAYFVDTHEREANSWVLIDTGIPGSANKIRRAAAERYGENAKPSAVILTHGHFDHASSALELAEKWNVPIYAHRLETPYLTGKSDYPPQDPTVGGALALMSRFFPHGGFDFGSRVEVLPDDGAVPFADEWRWIHTPGHTAGHVSIFRERDRVLLAGDALATMNQDSWISNVTEKREFYRTPSPFTTDWRAARVSVEKLAELNPAIVAAGHGQPIDWNDTAEALKRFARDFTPPPKGRYVNAPAIADENGVRALPPPVFDPLPTIAAGLAVAALVGVALTASKRGKKR